MQAPLLPPAWTAMICFEGERTGGSSINRLYTPEHGGRFARQTSNGAIELARILGQVRSGILS